MSCLRGRKNHKWARRLRGDVLQTNAFKMGSDTCTFCGKMRFEVEAQKKRLKREKQERELKHD